MMQQLRDCARSSRERFDFVSVGVQDASRCDLGFLIECAGVAREAGIDRFRLADTVGIWSPDQVGVAVAHEHVLVDGDVRLSQSGVILDYLAEKTGQFAGADRREVLRWVLWDNHKLSSQVGALRFLMNFLPPEKRPEQVIGPPVIGRHESIGAQMNESGKRLAMLQNDLADRQPLIRIRSKQRIKQHDTLREILADIFIDPLARAREDMAMQRFVVVEIDRQPL